MLHKKQFRMNKHSLCMLCICDHATSVSLMSHFLTLLIDSLKHFRLKGQCCASMLLEYQVLL